MYNGNFIYRKNLNFYKRNVELYLRGKLIEKKSQNIKVFPSFSPPESTDDILLITDSEMLQEEFFIYINIFEGLGLKYNVWDISKYNGLSFDKDNNERHSLTWIDKYRGKCIVFPISCKDELKDYLNSNDIISHFVNIDENDEIEDFDSGVVFIGEISPKQILINLFEGIELISLENEEFSDNFFVGEPTIDSMKLKAKSKIF